jgi:hypothetical protein
MAAPVCFEADPAVALIADVMARLRKPQATLLWFSLARLAAPIHTAPLQSVSAQSVEQNGVWIGILQMQLEAAPLKPLCGVALASLTVDHLVRLRDRVAEHRQTSIDLPVGQKLALDTEAGCREAALEHARRRSGGIYGARHHDEGDADQLESSNV